MRADDSTTTPLSDENVYIAFLKDLDAATDADKVVEEYAERYPHLADELRAMAGMRQKLDRSAPSDGDEEAQPERLGDFRIVRRIGHGGMGEIYEAIQEPLNRRVAVKIIRGRHRHLAGPLQGRFLREQKVLAQLHHTHIVPIHAAGREEELQYFAMSYIDGAALHHVVRTARLHEWSGARGQTPTLAVLAAEARSRLSGESHEASEDEARANGQPQQRPAGDPAASTETLVESPRAEAGPEGERAPTLSGTSNGKLVLSPEYFRSVARVMIDAAEALQHAHQAGISHRDLKPSNLMVDTAEHCWVLDFGLAGYLKAQANGHAQAGDGAPAAGAKPAIDLGPEPDPPTVSGVFGTPDYMAPEQFQGRADARTDVWGLGVILYELLTLRRAFHGLQEIESSDPPRPRGLVHGLPLDLEAICWKAIRKEPAQRYPSARALADDLRHWLKSEPVKARPAHTPRRVLLWARRNKGWAVAIVLATAASMAFALREIHQSKLRANAARALVIAATEKQHEAEERAAAEHREAQAQHREAQTQQREALIQQMQRVRILPHSGGWRKSIESRVVEAKQLGGNDNSLRTQAIAALRELDSEEFKNLPYPAWNLAFDPQGRRLYSSWFLDQVIRVWDSEIDETRTLALKGDGPFAFLPDGTPWQLAPAGKDDRTTLVLQDLARETVLRRFTSPRPDRPFFVDFAMTPSGSHAAALWQASKPVEGKDPPDDAPPVLIVVWEAVTGAVVRRIDHSAPAVALALAPDGRMLAVGDARGNVAVWTLPDGKPYTTLSAGDNRIQCLAFGREPRVSYLEKPDAPAWQLAVGDGGGIVTMLDLQNRRIRNIGRGSSDDIKSLAFRSDGAVLASVGRGGPRLWDVAAGRMLLDLHAGNFQPSVAFSPDSRRLAVGRWGMFGDTDGVRVYELCAGRGMRSLLGLQAKIERLAFSGDGRLIAALSDEWRVGIWDRTSSRLLHLLSLPPGFFADNAWFTFDPTARRLACSGHEHATLWDLETGRLLQTWKLRPGLQDKLAFHGPDQLFLFRVETRDGVPPFTSPYHPREHPRVYRLYNLLGTSPLRPVKEIGDHEWGCFGIHTPADGRFLLAEGLSLKDGRTVRSFVAYDGRTGETLWSMPSHLRPQGPHASFTIDPTGTLLVLSYPEESRSTWLKLPGREWIADRGLWPSVLAPGGNRWFSLGTDRATQHHEWHYFPDGQKGPEIALAEQEHVVGRLTFGADGRLAAWGGSDGAVVVCDLAELQRAMAQFGLGW